MAETCWLTHSHRGRYRWHVLRLRDIVLVRVGVEQVNVPSAWVTTLLQHEHTKGRKGWVEEPGERGEGGDDLGFCCWDVMTLWQTLLKRTTNSNWQDRLHVFRSSNSQHKICCLLKRNWGHKIEVDSMGNRFYYCLVQDVGYQWLICGWWLRRDGSLSRERARSKAGRKRQLRAWTWFPCVAG